jgi:hypothetical protein
MLVILGCLFLAALVNCQPDPSLYGLTYPDENSLRTFTEGYSQKVIDQYEREGKGAWTEWLDRDYPMPQGTGEFENVLRERVEDFKRGQCLMWCEAPLSMEVRLSDFHSNLTTSDFKTALHCPITNTKVYNPLNGFSCDNFNQWNGKGNCDPKTCMQNGLGAFCEYCPDVQVRYFCTGVRNCMPAAKRSLDEDGLRKEIQNMLGVEGAEDMLITLDAWDSPKRQQKEKRSKESETADLLSRLLKALKEAN